VAASRLRITALLAPHWQLLSLAFLAMIVQAGVELLEPWPLKVIFDYVLGSKPVPSWLAPFLYEHNRLAILNTAALAVVGIAVISAASTYTQKYLSTAVGKRVGFDLRHLLYHHV
jgi:ATP-binding cassette subfamily B protein